jgi:hypothetical protein
MGRGIIIGGIVAAIVLIGGGAAAFMMLKGSGDQLMDKVPASSDVIVTAYLNPSAGQKTNLFRLAGNFPALGSEDDIKQQVGALVDQMFAEQGITHDDFDWIGDQVVIAVDVPEGTSDLDGVDPDVSVILDVDDEGAASATIDKLQSADEDSGVYTQVGDGVAVIASSQENLDLVQATMDGNQPALADDANYQATVDGLPDGRLGTLYVSGSLIGDATRKAAEEEIGSMPGVDTSSIEALRGIALSISAEPTGFAIDTRVGLDTSKLPEGSQEALDSQSGENQLISAVPSDAYGFYALRGLDAALVPILDQIGAGDAVGGLDISGVLGSLTGDVVLEVTPGSDGAGSVPQGALLIGTNDEERVRKLLDLLPAWIEQTASGSLLPGVTLPGQVPPISVQPDGSVAQVSVDNATLDHGGADDNGHDHGAGDDNGHQGGDGATETGSQQPEVSESEYQGVQITTVSIPDQPDMRPSWAVNDGAVIIGSTPEAVEAVINVQKGGDSIESSASYTAAADQLGGAQPLFFLDLQSVIGALETAPDMDEISSEDAANLEPLKSIIVGSEVSSDSFGARVFIQIGET